MVVSLEWRGKGEDIKIAGEFNGWEPSPAARTHDMWQVNLDLQPGRLDLLRQKSQVAKIEIRFRLNFQ